MERGEVYLVDLEPTRGAEQRGRRPILIVSRQAFNKVSPAMVCPITAGGEPMRLAGFTVSLATTGMTTTGVVLCSQIRAIDIKAHNGRRIERAPDLIINEVIDVLMDLLE